ncbi:N-carbamoyl-L-amino-acid hydrolase [Streptosporangium becharense]|uniref:N-carbamoyl-L-amino-acid hydrolase n=2 Tax=Streptosporangium becharense TaxID=1816182 RepID=A0A7W9IF77_9ACTN|nr:N-carbamoyl-L-amino-acid hydrolase [Streptosporangium becharense]MBB5819023.1 N-carbamoyl-L-amino-acid hydrolase [Streptosporangium becharense]
MFDEMWGAIEHLGRDARTGGYLRDAWSPADMELRLWFRQEAARRGLDLREDRNGNLWAWWGDPSARPGVVTGSHLDSVRQGGAFDGPLGVVSAFAALDLLRARGVRPGRPLGVACFTDEEGARFGVPCVGSRLLTGLLDPDRARALLDDGGDSLAEVLRRAGRDPDALGRDDETLRHVGVFVELHVEQGRGLVHRGAPVGVASAIWPHGRWRFDFHGQANHAGTTLLADRDDPMLPFARTVLHARQAAERRGVVATFGKVRVSPNNANAVPGLVAAWLDARGGDEAEVGALVAELTEFSGAEVTAESWTPVVDFDVALRERVAAAAGGAPALPTGAGHDAGILASAGVPSAMVFVRNPTGISHSPDEHAEADDCHAGVAALASVLEDLCTR